MKKNWFQILKRQLRIFNLRKNNRPVIFVICVFIASVLWLVSVLGKSYDAEVSVPIQFTNLPKDKVLINNPPRKITLKLESNGFTLLRHKLQLTINPVNFNVKQFIIQSTESDEQSTFTIDLKQYIPQISKQISSDITILDVIPQTINFYFDQIVSTNKKVAHNFTLNFDNHYFLSDSIKFSPDSVLITGPQSVVEQINIIQTSKLEFKKLNASVNKKNIKLEPIQDITYSPKKVAVTIPVSLYTEYTAEIPITQNNVPDSLNMIVLPGRVKIKCLVSVEQYANLDVSSFIFAIDYLQIDPESNKYSVLPVRAPSYIKSLTYSPLEVDYLVQKKK